MISFDQAEVRVPTLDAERTIIHRLTVDLPEPRVALIGANGSGKSTIARLINGLVLPAQGTVSIPGEGGARLDTSRDGAQVRRRVGFVFTDPRSQLVMPTVEEDVSLSLKRRFPNRAERAEAVTRTLERFGLSDLATQSVHTLSGGQQQLVALASVLATEPDIIVADEPTTLLDLRNSRMISDLLLSLDQQLIVATHDLGLAARFDRVLVIDEGRIIFDGAASDAIAFYRGRM